MRIAIVSDTHMPRGRRAFPERCRELMQGAELILHIGDFVDRSVLEEIEALGPPVAAVHGNMDSEELKRSLPARRIVEADGARLGLIHDAGPSARRLERMRECFPDADAVVFGHSHIPLLEESGSGFQIFNPGSATDRRRQPSHSMGVADAGNGALRFEHVFLD
jgi:uncharacterized protein